MTDRVKVAAVGPDDWPEIVALLSEAGLPTADLNASNRPDFLVARLDDQLIGAVGIERYGEHGLLRSLVIDPRQRGSGVGEALLRRLEASAASSGVADLWLLTIDADGYFVRHGYRRRDRQAAPREIRETREFSELCPGSAILMSRSVG